MSKRTDKRKVLMIAFNYPPAQGSSGVHRTTSFARHLASAGWSPVVLTVSPFAHPSVSADASLEGLEHIPVRRAWAVDAARHLSIAGKYIAATARPDRWASWAISGAVLGAFECLRSRPAAVWSTFPIPTAHRLGDVLSRLSGAPWIADFRDPMTPANGRAIDSVARIETRTIQRAAKLVFVSDSARESYVARFPDRDPADFHVIANGFDEQAFRTAELQRARVRRDDDNVTLLHSGALYRQGRNPSAFLDALCRLRERNAAMFARLKVVFRASTLDDYLTELIAARNLGATVSIEPAIGYSQALAEMMESDVLVLMQGREFNRQIPAKAYEYLRSGRPMLVLADSEGESHRLLKDFEGTWCAPLDDAEQIAIALETVGRTAGAEQGIRYERPEAQRFSREGQAALLVRLLESMQT